LEISKFVPLDASKGFKFKWTEHNQKSFRQMLHHVFFGPNYEKNFPLIITVKERSIEFRINFETYTDDRTIYVINQVEAPITFRGEARGLREIMEQLAKEGHRENVDVVINEDHLIFTNHRISYGTKLQKVQ
jgi:hypothetical protein